MRGQKFRECKLYKGQNLRFRFIFTTMPSIKPVMGNMGKPFFFKMLLLFAFLCEGGCFIPAIAREIKSQTTARLEIPQENWLKGWSFGLESSSYVSLKNHPENDRNPYGISVGVDRTYKFSSVELKISGHAFNSTNQSMLNYSHVDELAFRFRATDTVVGRARMTWSASDSYWRMGMWQPLFVWNYLKPEEQGLTGLFLNWKGSQNSFTFFASPLFIPSQGPSYHIHDGQFVSANPWFSIPVNQVLLGSGSRIIRYGVNMPDAETVIMNPSLAMKYSSQFENSWLSVSGAFKPSNQLAMGLTGKFKYRTLEGDVELYPFVLYHYLGNIEYGRRFENSEVILSLTGEWPNGVSIPVEQSAYQPPRSIVLSPMWIYFLNNKRDRNVTLAYLYRDVQEFSYVGDYDLALAASGADRYFFRSAVSLGYGGNLMETIPLLVNLRSAYDLLHKGVLIAAEISYKMSANWNVTMGMETIGIDDEGEASRNNPFIQFRSNDRIYGGVNYVF